MSSRQRERELGAANYGLFVVVVSNNKRQINCASHYLEYYVHTEDIWILVSCAPYRITRYNATTISILASMTILHALSSLSSTFLISSIL